MVRLRLPYSKLLGSVIDACSRSGKSLRLLKRSRAQLKSTGLAKGGPVMTEEMRLKEGVMAEEISRRGAVLGLNSQQGRRGSPCSRSFTRCGREPHRILGVRGRAHTHQEAA